MTSQGFHKYKKSYAEFGSQDLKQIKSHKCWLNFQNTILEKKVYLFGPGEKEKGLFLL